MTQHLRKLIMSFVVSAFFIGAFTLQTNAQELTKLWQRSVADESLPSWFTAATVRGLDYKDGKVYIPDRNAIEIRVLDAETGADVTLDTPFDLTGVGTFYGLNQLKISEDGAIFIGSLATSGTADFKFYWWTEDGGTFDGSYTFTDNTGRVGDGFAVVGSLSDNTIEIWLPEQSSTPGVIHVLTTSDNGTTWTDNPITLSGSNNIISSGAQVMPLAAGGNSDFYIASNGTAPARYDKDGAFIEGSAIAASGRSGFRFFEEGGIEYLATYSYRSEGNTSESPNGRIRLYDVTDPTASVIVNETDVIGNVSGNSISGDVAVEFNNDGSFNLYAVDAANGFVAYTTAEPVYADTPTNKVFFSEYIEGHSNNRALEIYNGTDSTVTLANYQIAQTFSGNWSNFHKFKEGATIAAGETYILLNASTPDSVFDTSKADELLSYNSGSSETPFDNPVHFTGKNGRALIHIDPITDDTTWIDVFGDVVDAEGGAWDVAGVTKATVDHTLIRKASVTEGNATALASFGTNYDDSEWIVKNKDIFTNLGMATEEEGPLAGDYFIPQRKSDDNGFISLHQAIHYVNSLGLSDATTLYITDDLEESTSLRINQDNLSEAINLTIQPAEEKQVTIKVENFNLVDTRYVTINGSNNDTDTRDLTIEKSVASGGLLGLLSYNRFVTIKNINLTYAEDFGVGTYAVLINRREGSTETGRAESVTFQNVKIGEDGKPFRDAFWLFGSTSNEDFFHLDVTLADGEAHVGRSFLRTQTHINTTVDGNTIYSYGSEAGDNPIINLNTPIEDFTLTNNEIIFKGSPESADRNYIGVNATNTLIENVLIANNTFSNADFTGTGTANSFIAFYHNGSSSSANFQFLHNSVNFVDNGQDGAHAAIAQSETGSSAASVEVFNNIFVNKQGGENSVVFDWTSSTLTSNHNNFDISENSNFATIGTETYATLGEFTNSLGFDDLSTSATVEFVSGTDLRLTGSSIGNSELAGIPIEAVPTDIDGTVRSLTAPYKGAFEGDVALTGPPAPSVGEFSLIAPDNFASINLTGDSTTVVEFTWEVAESEGDVTYMILLDSLNGDFSKPLFSTESDSNGIKTSSSPTFADLDETLDDLGYAQGASAELKWTVVATVGDSSRFANAPNTITISRLLGVGTEEEIEKPLAFSLSQNYPNPFNPTSNIRFTLPQANNVRLDVYNINGQLVQTLVNSRMSAGEHTVQFDAGTLASGVYIYRIISGNFVQSKKMTLIK